jgi:hypothetical protein
MLFLLLDFGENGEFVPPISDCTNIGGRCDQGCCHVHAPWQVKVAGLLSRSCPGAVAGIFVKMTWVSDRAALEDSNARLRT